MVRDLAEDGEVTEVRHLDLPVFAALEGGYVAEVLGPNIAALIQGLMK